MAWFYAMNLFWQIIPSTEITEILCSGKMDGVVIDAEHGSFTIQNIVDSIRIITLKGKMAIIRLKANRRIEQICVDNGCGGFMYSTTECNEKTTPGVALTRQNNYGRSELLYDHKNLIYIAQIESLRGFELIKDYTGSFDYYMLTPYDFSMALGLPGQFNCAKYLKYKGVFEKNVPAEKRACHIVENIELTKGQYKDYGLKCYTLDSLMLLERVESLSA